MDNNITLSLRNIHKDFNGNAVLNDLSMDFESGKIYVFVGENSSGKSTLVRILAAGAAEHNVVLYRLHPQRQGHGAGGHV